ncbi:Uncharacterised protein [Mycobacterium tuberculosis]|nr:Uncharacterised protein [Mycobacterium tuberculosis]CNX89971.1 Uncharacterised protein [Mycobacterium tuberculosis]CNZ47655.1 Uncharacterised protein [Mycobacterium tuberculosis]COT37598.1 Uncharacterised protein [Mycobacterium tuberculosis]COU45540.1 Uncharacterised protein [Mycobacterium tuberculosis]
MSTSQRRPGQAPVSSTAPERRCRADESGPNRGCSAVPNAHSTAVPVPSRSATKLRRWWRAAEIASASSCVCNAGKSPCSTTMLEAPSATTRSAAVMAVFSGSGSSSGVGSASTSAPSPAAAAAAASSGVITVIERSEPTPAAAVNVSTSMASTTFSRVCAENTGASLVLAAAKRLTAMIKPISPSSGVPLMKSSCQRRSTRHTSTALPPRSWPGPRHGPDGNRGAD